MTINHPPLATRPGNRKILITGAGGMLGDAVYTRLSPKYHVTATDKLQIDSWITALDITDPVAVATLLKKEKYDVIIHLAALTDLEYCQKNPDEAYKVNTESVRQFAEYARTRNIPFVYLSTACVFDGSKESYHEYDTPHPINIYGDSKYRGELIAVRVPKAIIIRAAWMVGGGPNKDKKFFNKIVQQLHKGASEIFAVHDKKGNISYTYDIAATIEYLLEKEVYGTFHHVCDGQASRFDIAKFIVANLPKSANVAVRPVDSSFFQQSYFSSRLTSETLINTVLKNINPALTRDWETCLKDYIKFF